MGTSKSNCPGPVRQKHVVGSSRGISSSFASPCNPEAGPRILFFSGGTALKETARELGELTRDTIHLITPFDSGGSSATLRRAFSMPAVGDIRARIMALADVEQEGNPEIYTLFAYRLPLEETTKRLQAELVRLVRGNHPLVRQVPEPANGIIREHLAWFAMRMPEDFPLAGANIGNLILTAGYLRNKRRLGPVIALFSRLVRARGVVRPLVESTAQLAVRLTSGEVIIGQHKFTGKGAGTVTSPITDIWLAADEHTPEPLLLEIKPRTAALIRSATCICYPVGSFYSSIVANLLPQGVGRAIAACKGPKVFIPNLGTDPELKGHSLAIQIERLLRPLIHDSPGSRPRDFLSHIIIDDVRGYYPGGIPVRMLKDLGIMVTSVPLVEKGREPLAAPKLLARAIFSMVRETT